MARWDSTSDLAKYGVAFLVHGLLDYVVDTHFQSVQQLDEEIENLEDLLFATNAEQQDVQHRSFELRKSLVLLRGYVLPMREVLNTLMRRDLHLVQEPTSFRNPRAPTSRTYTTTSCEQQNGPKVCEAWLQACWRQT
jgi:magnesium transporter